MKKKQLQTLSKSILCISAFAMLFTSCGGKKQQQQQQPTAVQVETMKVSEGNTKLERAYPATIKGKTDIEIRPQISGFITKVCVQEGQHVKKGQLLFVIDQVQLEAAVRSAEAAVASAKSNVATNELTVANKKVLREKNIISDYEYQTATLALASAKASWNQANQGLIEAKKNLSFANVTSPSDGVVGSIPSREGSLVGPSYPALTTVSDISEVYAYFSLNEKELLGMTNSGENNLSGAIKKLPEVNLVLADGTRYPLQGKVETISGVIDQSTGSASVRASFKNTNNMLRSGSTGSILIPNPLSNVIEIPQKATYEIQDKKFVYIVGKDNKAVSTPVEVSPLNDGSNYIVTSGLKAGDVVVVEGVGTLVKDGVEIAPKAAGAVPQAQSAK